MCIYVAAAWPYMSCGSMAIYTSLAHVPIYVNPIVAAWQYTCCGSMAFSISLSLYVYININMYIYVAAALRDLLLCREGSINANILDL